MADGPTTRPTDATREWGTPEGRRMIELLWDPPAAAGAAARGSG